MSWEINQLQEIIFIIKKFRLLFHKNYFKNMAHVVVFSWLAFNIKYALTHESNNIAFLVSVALWINNYINVKVKHFDGKVTAILNFNNFFLFRQSGIQNYFYKITSCGIVLPSLLTAQIQSNMNFFFNRRHQSIINMSCSTCVGNFRIYAHQHISFCSY